jgi:Poxvirus A32 protein
MDEIEEVNIKRFKIDEIDLNAKIVIIGKPGTGKTSIIKDIIYRHREKFTKVILMSGTADSSGDFKGVFPDIYMYKGYQKELIDKWWAKQQDIVKLRGKNNSKNQALLVLDDLMHDKRWVRERSIADIFMNGRHYDTLFICAMQYCMGITPELRTCVDYVFICRENNFSNKKKLYDHYCGFFPDFKMFCKVLDTLTVKYHCLVVKQRKNLSSKIEDNIFWYKADLHDEFQIGIPALWQYNKRMYDRDYESRSKGEDQDITEKNRAIVKGAHGRNAMVINMEY